MSRAMPAGRSVLLVCGLVVLTAALTHRPATPTAYAEPHVTADSLILGLDDVRRIAGANDLQSDPRSDADRPERIDPDAPGSCWAVSNQAAVFGSGWTQFRSVVYSAAFSPTPDGARMLAPVTQAVGSYPNAAAARAAFDRLSPALEACAALPSTHYNFTVDQENPLTVTLHLAGFSPATIIYRTQSAQLVRVSAQTFPDADRIAHTVLQAITDRIK